MSASKFETAIRLIDEAHAQDPRKIQTNGEEVPYELFYSRKMSDYLNKCDAGASETLRLAIRAQHLRRWEVPRTSYTMNKAGYHMWRTYLKKRQADLAAQICLDSGYSSEDASRVAALVKKENLKNDAETQTLEDVACLVFLDDQLEAFEKEHDEAKVIGILHEPPDEQQARYTAAYVKNPLILQLLTVRSGSGIEAHLDALSISKIDPKTPNSGHVADSWEEEEAQSSSASSESDTAASAKISSIPNAPPPTPISPSGRSGTAWGEFPSTHSPASARMYSSSPAQSPSTRPEKSTAVAGRMIAGALGMKSPQKSEETLAYERAIKEKESRRISREREERKAAEERRQKASRQVWDD
ncbi:MAG: hypothetical protein L6R41_000120 [Letrouitia leprolyta]|nr:MAG: hypothetical protein L6R41_000120 [Letrouitia leprolyta]